jgi:hypothetical protein
LAAVVQEMLIAYQTESDWLGFFTRLWAGGIGHLQINGHRSWWWTSIFWIPLAPVTTLKYRLYTYLPALSPSPFDNEFAGSPAMTASGMAGHFILKNTIG